MSTNDSRARRSEAGGRRDAPLAMSADAFRHAGHALVDRIADRLAAIPRRPVTRDDSPAGVRAALGLGGTLPEDGGDAGALLAAADALFDHSLFNAHPRFFTVSGGEEINNIDFLILPRAAYRVSGKMELPKPGQQFAFGGASRDGARRGIEVAAGQRRVGPTRMTHQFHHRPAGPAEPARKEIRLGAG